MKKILFYTDTPLIGGAEKHMLLLAKNINPEKYTVTLACSSYKQLNEWVNEFKQANIAVIRIKVSHKHDPRALLQLKKLLEKQHYDILHLHVWNPASCRYAFLAANPKIIKIVATEHDPFALNGIKKILKESYLKKISHTIAVSNANKELLLKLYPKLKGKISTIYNGIDLENFEKTLFHFSTQEKSKIRHQLFKSTNEEFIIITIATLHPRKGLKYLIEAYQQIQPDYPESKLMIIGEGPEKKRLEKQITKSKLQGKVLLLGQQDNIAKLLKSSDLFILPSIKEAFGLVLLEAMAAQLPIIASDVGGIPEIIQNHKNGELVEPANSKVLAEKMRQLMSNKALQEKIAFLGHHHVKNFSAKIMAKKTEEIYDEILS